MRALAFVVPPSGGKGAGTPKRGQRTLKEAKAELRVRTKEIKDRLKERTAEVRRAVKELAKLEEEAARRLAEVNAHADREVAQVKEAAAHLARICSDPEEAKRYFAIADRPEVEENEFNLNLPRYVDTFEPEQPIPVEKAISDFQEALKASKAALSALQAPLTKSGVRFEF